MKLWNDVLRAENKKQSPKEVGDRIIGNTIEASTLRARCNVIITWM